MKLTRFLSGALLAVCLLPSPAAAQIPHGIPGPGGITGVNDFGLYCTDYNTGAVTELVREGQPLNGKTVQSFSVLKAAAGSAGTSRAFNPQHQVVLLVTFDDHSTAIIGITLPDSVPVSE